MEEPASTDEEDGQIAEDPLCAARATACCANGSEANFGKEQSLEKDGEER